MQSSLQSMSLIQRWFSNKISLDYCKHRSNPWGSISGNSILGNVVLGKINLVAVLFPETLSSFCLSFVFIDPKWLDFFFLLLSPSRRSLFFFLYLYLKKINLWKTTVFLFIHLYYWQSKGLFTVWQALFLGCIKTRIARGILVIAKDPLFYPILMTPQARGNLQDVLPTDHKPERPRKLHFPLTHQGKVRKNDSETREQTKAFRFQKCCWRSQSNPTSW